VTTAGRCNWHQWCDRSWKGSLSPSHARLSASALPGCASLLSFASRARGGWLALPHQFPHTNCLQRCLFTSCIMSCGSANGGTCPFWAIFSEASVPSSLSPGQEDASSYRFTYFHTNRRCAQTRNLFQHFSVKYAVILALRSYFAHQQTPSCRGQDELPSPALKTGVWGDASPPHWWRHRALDPETVGARPRSDGRVLMPP